MAGYRGRADGTLSTALLAETYGKSGRVDEGFRAVAEGLATAEQNAQNHYRAELYRIQGELYLAQSKGDDTAAQASFDQGLAIARHQRAKSFELRAAMSLARLWQSQGKRDQAVDLLAPIYGWFTEGSGTADLIDARALFEALEAGRT